ncbi:MAG: hypothetical protein WAN48_12910 [Actinomycetes bacterium]
MATRVGTSHRLEWMGSRERDDRVLAVPNPVRDALLDDPHGDGGRDDLPVRGVVARDAVESVGPAEANPDVCPSS